MASEWTEFSVCISNWNSVNHRSIYNHTKTCLFWMYKVFILLFSPFWQNHGYFIAKMMVWKHISPNVSRLGTFQIIELNYLRSYVIPQLYKPNLTVFTVFYLSAPWWYWLKLNLIFSTPAKTLFGVPMTTPRPFELVWLPTIKWHILTWPIMNRRASADPSMRLWWVIQSSLKRPRCSKTILFSF